MYLPLFNTIFAVAFIGSTIIAAPSGPILAARSNINLEKRADAACLPSDRSDFARVAFFLQQTTAYNTTELAKAVANITIQISPITIPSIPGTSGIQEPQDSVLDIKLGAAFLGIFGKFIAGCFANLNLDNEYCVKLQDAAIVETDLDFMELQGGQFVPVLEGKRETVITINPFVQSLVDQAAPDVDEAAPDVGEVAPATVSEQVAKFLEIDLKIIATLEGIEFSAFIEAVKAYCDALETSS